uniref:Small ribosomal subunit protein uS11c n=1 Tax=Berberis dasystachya TaxID=1659732 RepID=A0A8K1ZSF2_9MAGN|nr:ribosomal protein S11 [Berberis dasystachya]UHJ17337.1 ribosomal protein S11 [Berberis dasystachya]
MAKPISRTSLPNYVRFIPRKNPRFTSRKSPRFTSRKSSLRISKGVINIQASFNNTIVTVTDTQGQVVSWSSAGTCGFRGPRRGTPFAAQTATANAISIVIDQGMQEADVRIKGPGLGRDSALRAIRRSGIRLNCVMDVTPLPHNGCRPPKKRRV